MLGRTLLKSVNVRPAGPGRLRITSSFSTTSYKSFIDTTDEEKPTRPVRKLKEWRKMPEMETAAWSIFRRERDETDEPKRLWLLPLEVKKWMSSAKKNHEKIDQRFIEDRHRTLGCDLAAAHFLVFREGKVKFVNQPDWKVANEDGSYDLPRFYDVDWKITHLDASNVNLYYEGIENFKNLRLVCWASFKGNKYFDDWCMDKVSAELPNVEFLDVSGCPLLTERGLEAVYRLYNLKKFIVTDWHKQPSFELTCTLLEDCCPGLTVEILEPPDDYKKKK